MKLLFLCKRRPQGKDLIKRSYGRFYYLPKILAENGHEVHILLLSYKNEPKISHQKDKIIWTSISLIKHGPLAYIREAKKIIQEIRPDWIAGFSDTYYGILAQKLGAKYNINSLIDAYDNYESYIPWMKPLHHLWHRSLSRATLVTAAGPSLINLLGKSRPGKPTEIIPMAADPMFRPLDKTECRKKLGLPLTRKLVGYSGSTIHSSRGINLLFEAVDSLKLEIHNIELALSGRKGSNVSIPSDAKWLGYIPDEDMPALLNSLDVLVVMNKPSSFGNYSYPVKLYEAMKCQTPVVVTETLSTKWIMRNNQELLVKADNEDELRNAIKFVLNRKKIDYGSQINWQQIGESFEEMLSGGLALNDYK